MTRQGRLGDRARVQIDQHGCPACVHAAIGPAIAGSPDVMVNRRPALRVGDPGIHAPCCGANVWTADSGSDSVFINGRSAHRVDDRTRHCGGIGVLVDGSGNVEVGGLGDPLRHAREATMYRYGTDTSAQPLWEKETFYIGKIGSGIHPYPSDSETAPFNLKCAFPSGTATKPEDGVRDTRNYAYWVLVNNPHRTFYPMKPGVVDYRTDADAAGYEQGIAAATACDTGYFSNLIGGTTIFADIEGRAFTYNEKEDWQRYTRTMNQYVLLGFFRGIREYGGKKYNPGVYTNTGDWTNVFGEGYDPHEEFVLWVSFATQETRDEVPLDELTKVFTTTNPNYSFGGQHAVIWQYHTGRFDGDVTAQVPSTGRFTAMSVRRQAK